jgi:hypothetical protein
VDAKVAANKSDELEETKGRARKELKRYMCVGGRE